MGLLALVCKKNDGGSNDNKSADGDECVSVVSAATGPVKLLTVVDGNVKSPLTVKRNQAPLDIVIGSHIPLVEIEDPDITVTAPRSPDVAVLSGDKRTSVRRKKVGRKRLWAKRSWSTRNRKGRYQKKNPHCVTRQISLRDQSFFIR
ncbi:unnamed protein product [Schistosoma curassoni]|uniref:50S ribosomal protein L21 n=1 Tax=Schistosoma curassoni TaxID=6186 RepID=A0A183K701_9TREM|nr:unnamed protein product [Schistosoma curassoni]